MTDDVPGIVYFSQDGTRRVRIAKACECTSAIYETCPNIRFCGLQTGKSDCKKPKIGSIPSPAEMTACYCCK